jgi:hypothetical protein
VKKLSILRPRAGVVLVHPKSIHANAIATIQKNINEPYGVNSKKLLWSKIFRLQISLKIKIYIIFSINFNILQIFGIFLNFEKIKF